MRNKLRPVQCGNCKFFKITNQDYKYEGECIKDSEVKRIHHVCNKLETDYARRCAKINKRYNHLTPRHN